MKSPQQCLRSLLLAKDFDPQSYKDLTPSIEDGATMLHLKKETKKSLKML